MKRFLLIAMVAGVLLSSVFLVRAAWRPAPASQVTTVSAAEAGTALDGPAGWHYRHSQPTHWRSCLLQH
jgi:hypothetical protein